MERFKVGYNGVRWHVDKLYIKMWMGLVDYNRVAWKQVQFRCNKNLQKTPKIMKSFEDAWVATMCWPPGLMIDPSGDLVVLDIVLLVRCVIGRNCLASQDLARLASILSFSLCNKISLFLF